MKNKSEIREFEKLLYDYKNLDLRTNIIDLDIEMLMNDVSCAGVSYEFKGGPTNSFSSTVENEVVRRDEYVMSKIEMLNKKKNNIVALKQKISKALSMLNEEEYKIIELRYIDTKKGRRSWIEISMNLGMNVSTCHRIKNKIMNKLTDQIA